MKNKIQRPIALTDEMIQGGYSSLDGMVEAFMVKEDILSTEEMVNHRFENMISTYEYERYGFVGDSANDEMLIEESEFNSFVSQNEWLLAMNNITHTVKH